MDIMDSPLSIFQCLIDMLVGALPEAFGGFVGFMLIYVPVSFAEIFGCFVQAAYVVIDLIFGMVIEVFVVIYTCLFDLADSGIDLTDGSYFIFGLLPAAGAVLQHPAGSAQVR